MFTRRLHPTPSGFAVGLAVIALWALVWIWFFAQLSRPHPAAGRNAMAEERAQPSAFHAVTEVGSTGWTAGSATA